MKKELTQNTFDQLIMDLHPLEVPKTVYTNALNATIVTKDGNEGLLLNDMGNGRVETAYLPEGYIPLGICSLGGIIYVACYNPLTDKGLIGCFPSPERNVSSDEVTDLDVVLSNNDFKWNPDKDQNGEDLNYSTTGAEVYYLKKGLFQEEFTFNPGDKFIVYGNPLSDNFEKLWIEEEYDDFFGENTKPLWENEDESELDELADYDKGDMQKDKMEYYSKPIITIEYENNDVISRAGGNIEVKTFYIIQKHVYTDDNGEEKTEYLYYGDSGKLGGDDWYPSNADYSFSIRGFDENVSINNNGTILDIGSSQTHLQEIIGVVTVTVTMNGETTAMDVNIEQEGILPNTIEITSIGGTIGYTTTNGNQTKQIDSIESLWVIDTINSTFDFSDMLFNIDVIYDDGTEKISVNVSDIEIEKLSYFINSLYATITDITKSLNLVKIQKFDYSVVGGNDFYDMLDAFGQLYNYITETYEVEYNDEGEPNGLRDYLDSIPYFPLCTLTLQCSYSGQTASILVPVYVVPQYIFHMFSIDDESSGFIVHTSNVGQNKDGVVYANINVTNYSLGNIENDDDITTELFEQEYFPRVYSGLIDMYCLPFSAQYNYLELTKVSTNDLFDVDYNNNEVVDWNSDNCLDDDGLGDDYEGDDKLKNDLNDIVTLEQQVQIDANTLSRKFLFNFIDDNINSHN